MAKKKTSQKKSNLKKSKKNISNEKNNIKATIKPISNISPPPKPNTIPSVSILEPNPTKIALSIFISSILILGWINMIKSGYLSVFTFFIYVILSTIWILAGSMASCIFVHLSSKNRITSTLGFLIISLIALFVGTAIYVIL